MRMTSEELRKRNDKLIQEADKIERVIKQLEWDLNALIQDNRDGNEKAIERIRQQIKDLEVERFYKLTSVWSMD